MGRLALQDVRTRLAHTLVGLAGATPSGVVTATHEELAAMVGTRQEEVTKLLRDFPDRGLVA